MSDSSTISIITSHPPLPEGWKGTPQQLIEWMDEHAIYEASGEFLTGQIGGSVPSTNVGIFVNGQEIMVWDPAQAKYVPLLTMAIGTIADWPSMSQAAPANYVFCEGQELLITDYNALFNAIGRAYAQASDDPESLSFRLPDFRGRVAVGAGDAPGDYDPRNPTNGKLVQREVGAYFGNDWPTYQVITPVNAPVPRYSVTLQGASTSKPNAFQWNKSTFNGIQPPSLGVRKIIRYQ